MDNLIESFILLALDEKKGKFLIDSLSLNYGIAGAILLELSKLNKIDVKDKRLVVIDKKNTNDKVLGEVLQIINKAKRNKRVKFWVNKIGNRASGLKKTVLKDLSTNGIIKTEQKSYLWGLIKVYRYPVVKSKQIREYKEKLRTLVLNNKQPEINELLILSLMYSCKLTRVIFPNKSDYRIANRRIKELTKNIEIGDAVGQALKEIQTAVIVATTSAFVGASSSVS